MSDGKISAREQILIVSLLIENAGGSPFSCEALVIACWRRSPITWGLAGYNNESADSNKVIFNLCGARGMVAQGWLNKVDKKRYELTNAGRKRAKELLQGLQWVSEKETPDMLFPGAEALLLRQLNTEAFQAFTNGSKAILTFSDARNFFSIDGLHGDIIQTRIDSVQAQLDAIDIPTDLVLGNGRSVSAADVEQLREVARYLRERFERHLKLMVTRK